MGAHEQIHAFLDQEHANQVAFLAELVKVPTDNPPGDCARHADVTAALLENLGFNVEWHRVPDAVLIEARMMAVTNLIVRHRFGDGPTIALNAHGDVVPRGAGWRNTDGYAT